MPLERNLLNYFGCNENENKMEQNNLPDFVEQACNDRSNNCKTKTKE